MPGMMFRNRVFSLVLWFMAPVLAGGSLLLTGSASESSAIDSESVNLALRRVGHQLLLLAGDSTTAIAPVRHIGKQGYLLRLETGFDYDTLPGLLRESLLRQGITADYQVSVMDCASQELILGYAYISRYPDSSVPCVGREVAPGCSEIRVVFLADKARGLWKWATIMGLVLATCLVWIFFFARRKSSVQAVNPAVVPAPFSGLRLSDTELDVSNLKIYVAGSARDLTFREAKLLHYFFQYPNELLERERILKAVWEDEGIIVDRSLDVFVSRLRKILVQDTGMRILNVRGVGYRLVVQ